MFGDAHSFSIYINKMLQKFQLQFQFTFKVVLFIVIPLHKNLTPLYRIIFGNAPRNCVIKRI